MDELNLLLILLIIFNMFFIIFTCQTPKNVDVAEIKTSNITDAESDNVFSRK